MSSALATALILHPNLTRTLKLLATTVGRDKTYRFIQYLSRLIAWSILKGGGEKQAAARWDGLKSGLASARKVMRLLKPLEHLQSAMNVANTPINPSISSLAPLSSQVSTFAQLARQLAYAGYLSTDMIVWLQSVKFLRLPADRIAKINKTSQRFWLSGISFSLISSLASLIRLRAEGRRMALSSSVEMTAVGGPEGGAGVEERRAKGRALLKERQTLISQIVQDSMDWCIPGTNLGFLSFNDGALGALGAATSYMALQQQWIKVNGPVGVKK